MSLLINLLDKYIFSGIPSMAVYDLIKSAWNKASDRSWEDLYLDAFQMALNEARPRLTKYTRGESDVAIDKQMLSNVLHHDLVVSIDTWSYSQLSDDRFINELAKAMAAKSVLVIGGHVLSEADYSQLVSNLVRSAKSLFKEAILDNDQAFRRMLLDESLSNQMLVRQVQNYLINQFGLQVLEKLETIEQKVDDVVIDVQNIERILSTYSFQQTGATRSKRIFISSPTHDLPIFSKEVIYACLREGMLPIISEHWPTNDDDAIAESLRMVDEADIYLGIFAYHYGHVPQGYDISLSEMEYNRAIERGIPRLIFLIHEASFLNAAEIGMEREEDKAKLHAFKARLKAEQDVNFFISSVDLRGGIVDSLSKYRQINHTAFHYVNHIPEPPEAYIAHPYTLLQTHILIGRQAELNVLADWVAKPSSNIYATRILNIVAIGGMGKSALAWKWFSDIVPHEMKPMAGRMWWSFYESDATFENFVIRTLSYISKRSKEEIQKLPPLEREEQLLAILDREPFLLVLDGLERLLIAYASIDADRLADDDLDSRTTNIVVAGPDLPGSAAQSFSAQHRLRKTTDFHTGILLRKLANVRASRILITSRLYPADLQTETGSERPGSKAVFLQGLSDDDALNLWHALGVSGSSEALLPLFHTFDNHPLLLQALAGEIANYRRAPGDFERWRQDHPDFNPFQLTMMQVKSHVLQFALRGLRGSSRKVLHTLAAFRMPASYDTITALLVGEGKSFRREDSLIAVLINLEDRGLLGWDQYANRYDLHPIVRGIAWSGLANRTKQRIYEKLLTHYSSLPEVIQDEVNCLEDLTATIELYNVLIGLKRFDEACEQFCSSINKPMLYLLSTNRQRAELLEKLFPDGLDHRPRVKFLNQAYTLDSLATAYSLSGQPKRAVPLLQHANALNDWMDNYFGFDQVCIGLTNLSDVFYASGALHEAETCAHEALYVSRELLVFKEHEVSGLICLGSVLAARGMANNARVTLDQALQESRSRSLGEGTINALLAQLALWEDDPVVAFSLAEQYYELAQTSGSEQFIIHSARLKGAAALSLGRLEEADEYLHLALVHGRTVNLVVEELPTLVALAQVRHRQGDFNGARELLNDIWEPAERGPYPLFHADAFNVLAQVERDTGNRAAAITAAMMAYRLAWCDGPPFAYHWGLQIARIHLNALDSLEPILPPFDVSKQS